MPHNNKTLLSVNNYYYRRGGAEFVFLEQNQIFENMGWNVIPFSMHHANNLDSPWSEYFVDEIEFGEKYSFIEKLARIPKVIYSKEAQQKINRLVSATNPDIAHLHNIYHHISPSILSVLRKNNIPVVLTLHDLKLACPAYKMLSQDNICERCKNGNIFNVVRYKCIKDSTILSMIAYLETSLHRYIGSYIKNVSRFVVPSRFYLEKFVEWGFNPDQFEYIPNFVDLKTYTPEFSAGKTFLYFGRLGHEKGLSTLIKAAALTKVPLTIVGTGPEMDSLRNLADTLDVEVSFPGYQTGEALHNYIRSAKCIVLPSEWYENAPITIMEAYALGKPVIGASIGGIPELIQKDVTGYIFESGSVEDLASAFETFRSLQPEKIAEMGRAGRAWVEAEFTAKQYYQNLVSLYSKLGITI